MYIYDFNTYWLLPTFFTKIYCVLMYLFDEKNYFIFPKFICTSYFYVRKYKINNSLILFI